MSLFGLAFLLNSISLRAFTVYMKIMLRLEISLRSFAPKLAPDLIWTLIMKLPYTKVKFHPEVKSQTCLSSLRVFSSLQYKNSLKYKQVSSLLTFFICLHNQLSSFNSIIVQMSEKRDSSNSKNEWLLLSVTFTAKLELVFALTFENAFS